MFGSGHGSEPLEDSVCRHVATGNSYLWTNERWAWERAVQVDGWGRDVEAPRGARFAETASRKNRGPGGGEGLGSRLCADRDWRRRAHRRQADAKRAAVALR